MFLWQGSSMSTWWPMEKRSMIFLYLLYQLCTQCSNDKVLMWKLYYRRVLLLHFHFMLLWTWLDINLPCFLLHQLCTQKSSNNKVLVWKLYYKGALLLHTSISCVVDYSMTRWRRTFCHVFTGYSFVPFTHSNLLDNYYILSQSAHAAAPGCGRQLRTNISILPFWMWHNQCTKHPNAPEFLYGVKLENNQNNVPQESMTSLSTQLNDSWKPSLKQGRGSLTNQETITSIDPYVFRNLAIIFKWEGSMPLHPQFITSHKALDLSPAYHYRQT